MKKLNPESLPSSIPAGNTDPGPIVDFAHLASVMAPEATDDFLHPPYGFSAADEEDPRMKKICTPPVTCSGFF